MVFTRAPNKEPPSSDAETDRMEGMDERESQLETMSKEESDKEDSKKRSLDSSEVEDNSNPFIDTKSSKKVKNGTGIVSAGASDKASTTDAIKEEREEVAVTATDGHIAEEEEEDDEEVEEAEEDDDHDHDHDGESKQNDDSKNGEERNGDADMDDTKREENRVIAMNGLKDIEILFAQLKDQLYETQLTKLEFELKLCENNQHPELIEYMKMVDEDFKKKTERLMNLQKCRLKCLDNQTRATRVSIHQQFMKQRQDLKAKEIVKITTDWYDINKERRTMDMQTLNLPEYYQFNKSINAFNIENNLPALVNQRNAVFKELSVLQGLVDYKKVIPSSLNNLTGCSQAEIEADLKEIGMTKKKTKQT